MNMQTQLLLDHTITTVWDGLPDDSKSTDDVESEVLKLVIARIETFKVNPQAFRPVTPIDKNAIKQRFAKAYMSWSDDETAQLGERYRSGASVATLTREFERSRGAIVRRLERLGLIDPR